MKTYPVVFAFLFAASALLSSCSSGEAPAPEADNSSHLIPVTLEQFRAENMEIGDARAHTFTRIYKTNGVVTASPQTKADVYSFVPGIIKSIDVSPGEFVKHGRKLCVIQSKEFISMQQQYLESLAQQKAIAADYKRVKALFEEKIASEKTFYSIESQYLTVNAQLQALQAALEILGIDMQELAAGQLLTELAIRSPIDGYVAMLDCNVGQFVDLQQLLMKVIDNSDLQLHFIVYQEVFTQLRNGQHLRMYTPDKPEDVFTGQIISIGKAIDPVTKGIDCIARPEERLTRVFVDGMYFQVELNLDTLQTLALPDEAILKTGSKRYILVKMKEDDKQMYFRKTEVETGTTDNGFTEIIADEPPRDVLLKGAFYFFSE